MSTELRNVPDCTFQSDEFPGMAIDLWDKVCEQIERDIRDPLNDLQALYTMLQQVPKDVLIAYLPEEDEWTATVSNASTGSQGCVDLILARKRIG